MSECPENNESLTAANPGQTTPTSPIINNDKKGITGNANSGGIFDINKIISSVQDYMAINAVVNEKIGYEFKWFRAVPQQRSKDVIFQEYTLSNVEECPIDVKAVIPDGRVPDSKYNFDLMGLEYELPFELQIDKKYWEQKAGFGTAPQKKDIVYFPMANKLFQVESSHVIRGFMEQETAWKINLIKYQPEASRREKDALKETIDIYTVSTEEIFGEAINNDIKKAVNDTQFNQYNATSQDKYKLYDVSLATINKTLEMYGTVVSQSFYDLQTATLFNAIRYDKTDTVSKTNNRAITAWFQPRTISQIHTSYDVMGITPIVTPLDPSTMYDYDASLYSYANYTVTVKDSVPLQKIRIDDNIVISRSGALNFYAKVVAIDINPARYHCLINAFVQEEMTKLKSDWNSQRGYKLMVKDPVSIIDGVNDFGHHNLAVNVYANQYIAINYGHTYADEDAYVIRMNEKLNDNEWYGIVVNIGNTWGQYNIYVWKKHPTDKVTKLQNIFYQTLRLYPEDIYINNYTINRSPAYLTNIRIFNETIEEEKQRNELLSYFSQDGDKIVISDNGDAIMKIPYVTRQR